MTLGTTRVVGILGSYWVGIQLNCVTYVRGWKLRLWEDAVGPILDSDSRPP